jgi:hypothetical protein
MASMALVATLALVVAGCGARKTSAGADGSAQPSPAASTTPAATATPNGVTLVVAQTPTNRYDPLRVIIINGFATPVGVSDHQSGCSTVSVERQGAGGWTQVAPCQQATPTVLIPVNPGSSLDQTVQPGAASSAGGAWEPGTYRVAVHYSGGDTGAGASGALYSQPFIIG